MSASSCASLASGAAQLELLAAPVRPRPPSRRVLSYGGGLDSWVMLLEAVRRCIRLDAVVFIDVGDSAGEDPAEWPGTYRHLREVVQPFCARHGIRFEWLDSQRYPVRDARSLFAWLWARRQIPVAMPGRICTVVAKVERFERWLTDAFPGDVVEVWIGFEAGEEARAAKDPNAGKKRRKRRAGDAVRVNRFPLIEWSLCRCRCLEVARRASLPLPHGSACSFCPFSSKADWQRLSREQPATFRKVVALEARKQLTTAGLRLSIMGFRATRDASGAVIRYKAPTLPEFIRGDYRPRVEPCRVCGAAERARKTVGCGFADDAPTLLAS
ncbi:hypothetical protein [Pyxidicoccus sp. MSG2]|uniref:hypothetical protein n=1 Tax=Pyxidicoccus sp. MSG2 TaxID=2996790 RepID=UPI00226DC7CF|nr:hypothetical protein [Pyxidicoccus sp. MSG2]MCY1023959.1 hypothetical protein [Pyxidicoccus sp. MSG2]